MFEILTSDEMKRTDALAIAAGISGSSLIEAAGFALAHQIKDKLEPCPVLFLCGSGNNGADGIVAAIHLKKAGWPVRVACLAKKATLKGDAALVAKRWEGEFDSLNSNLGLKDTALVVDAVFGTGFGTGLTGVLDPELVTLFDKIRTKKLPVVAVDIPSGMDATTGMVAEGALKADLTVTFCRKKLAHVLYPSKSFCGAIHVAHIGIGDEMVAGMNTQAFENNPALWVRDFPLPDAASHKFTRGHTVVYGGVKRTGAACLAAHAAQVIGSGLVTITSKPETRAIYATYRASIMVDEWDDLEEFKASLRTGKKNTLIFGPGAGFAETDTKDAFEAALSLNLGGVLDADVFTLYKGNAQSLFSKLSPRYVLTPHEGEFERIFGVLPGNKLDRARAAAKMANAVVLLKGADTVIAAPDGTAIIQSNSPATLATGGSGDVLSGLIAGICAQGMPAFMAAATAIWLHAEAAKKHGLGLTAEDIISNIPQTLNKLFQIQPNNPYNFK